MKSSREYHLLRVYGITLEQYLDLLKKQDGNCAVCKRDHKEFPVSLAVDHDHHSGAIRGLLCAFCNQRVIGRHRDPELLQRAADYLRGPYTGWFVPEKKKKEKEEAW
jgi:hypothetical protein